MPFQRALCLLFGLVFAISVSSVAQTETAVISGRVTDPTGAVIKDAEITATNIDTNISSTVRTNERGIYIFPSVYPGRYRLTVRSTGFKEIVETNLTVNVQDTISRNYSLAVGSINETMTVVADEARVNTESATVSTVVDRHFAENLPMNGRSFQTLIQLTPGVVLTASSSSDGGQFSANGQRASSNYWMVDGVSANTGVSSNVVAGDGFGGALGSFSVLGGTNSLVSVDAMQEFRIQTSTYAPEFGRTPGAQISIITRSGTNQFHGTAFDYLRNDTLDANNWFNNFAVPPLPKPKERQNDFGGTFSGPLLKDRTFFFFSYEGLRLRLPQTALSTVPDVTARQTASPALQPFLNAFPLPNGQDDPATGIAEFNTSFSSAATLDAYSLRIDHKLSDRLMLFGRYSYSPSDLVNRPGGFDALSVVQSSRIKTQTATLGATWTSSSSATSDFRFNFSGTNSSGKFSLDDFGGAVPPASLPLPVPFTTENSTFSFRVFPLNGSAIQDGRLASNRQRQFNVVDNLNMQRGAHNLKFGVDFRRMSPLLDAARYSQGASFLNVSAAETGNLFFSVLTSTDRAALLLRNLGIFAQDTWRINPRLILTYGLRWDVDFAPSSTSGPSLPAVRGFNTHDLSTLTLAPAGTPSFNTTYANLAPRMGIAYQLSQSSDWSSVLRGGFGVFYDLATSQTGNDISVGAYPFGSFQLNFGGTFPLSASAAAPPPIAVPGGGAGNVYAFDPQIKLPYTLQWNTAFEQALGKQQTITASYIGSVGRRLLQTEFVLSPNPNYAQAQIITNASTSDYQAAQLQFNRRMSRGLQILGSYTWSHSIDDASAGSGGTGSNILVPGMPNTNRGPSDFDIRHSFSAGITYEIPAPRTNALGDAILRGWSLQSVVQTRTAAPVEVSDVFLLFPNSNADVRPDVVAGQPLYLFGSQCASTFQTLGALAAGQSCPGGMGFNPAAFTDPPTDAMGNPLRQGTLPRNLLRGFGAFQWDFAVHRDFSLHEPLKLQLRAEMFNLLNHPNFGPPSGDFGLGQFGLSQQMLGQSLSRSNLGAGGFDPLYQIGGPRSIQIALKLVF